METCHIVVSGNPGVGKSTILNSTLGRQHFTAGVSTDGGGVTTAVSKMYVESLQMYLVDTPGVTEVDDRSSGNMLMLLNAISSRVNTKVLFIMTLASGRIKPADVLLFQLILDHVGRHNCRNVVLVINKVSDLVMLGRAKLKSVIRTQFGVDEDNIFLVPDYGGSTGQLMIRTLPFSCGRIRSLENGDWNEIARRELSNQQEEAADRRRRAEQEAANRRRIAMIQEQNAREVARLEREANRNRGGCFIL